MRQRRPIATQPFCEGVGCVSLLYIPVVYLVFAVYIALFLSVSDHRAPSFSECLRPSRTLASSYARIPVHVSVHTCAHTRIYK